MGSCYFLAIQIFFFMVLSVTSCGTSGKYGCSLAGVILGGRLLFTDKSGVRLPNPPTWIANRRLIFRQASFPARPAIGRGQIWIGRRGCTRGFCQGTNSTQFRTCGKKQDDCFGDDLCDKDLTLRVSQRLIRGTKFGLIATWNITNRSSCETMNKELIFTQKDLDGCNFSPEDLDYPKTFPIDSLSGKKGILVTRPHSLYNVTLQVTCGTGNPRIKAVSIRTDETGPSSAPTNLTQRSDRNSLEFRWDKPRCGKRNGNIIGYEVVFTKNRQTNLLADKTRNNFKYYFGLKQGDKYKFKVRAETTGGRGPYNKTDMYTF